MLTHRVRENLRTEIVQDYGSKRTCVQLRRVYESEGSLRGGQTVWPGSLLHIIENKPRLSPVHHVTLPPVPMKRLGEEVVWMWEGENDAVSV